MKPLSSGLCHHLSADLLVSKMNIQLGNEFTSLKDFKSAVADWSVAAKFPYRIHKSDPSRVSIKCRLSTCPFSIYAVIQPPTENAIITSISSEHTCVGSAQFKRTAASRLDWLIKKLPEILVIDNDTKPRAIVHAVQHHYQELITYDMAARAKHTIIRSSLSSQKDQFTRFPQYLRLLEQRNPDLYAHLALDPDTNSFKRFFVCPQTSRQTFLHCRPFIALDGTFTKTQFIQVLLLAVGIDAENHAVPLAWAMVESETEDAWRYFLIHLRQSIPEVNLPGVTVMSDRDKGLESADDELPFTYRSYCTQHIKNNIQQKFGLKARDLFAKIANAQTKEFYQLILAEIAEFSKPLADYINKIDRMKWAAPYFPGRTYGHHTSNIAESINATLQQERRLPCLELLDAIWHKHRQLRFQRRQEGESKYLAGERFTKYAQGFLKGNLLPHIIC